MEGGAKLSMAIHKAMDVIRQLRDLGVDADVDLPRICVVGKQSSGKSSVMEALTGISVPRAAGTCTRCAYEIYTSAADVEFSCAVSIRCEELGKLRLAETSDMSKVAELLGLAQTLLLSPIHLEKFRKTQEIPEKPGWLTVESLRGLFEGSPSPTASLELEFTRDVVQVDIRGREFQALQLIDLPGLIASAPNAELVSLIRDLCSDYIRRENTLIAMCCPFDDDLENQEVRALAKKFDAEGLRTVGILTKADRIPEGLETQWEKILLNQMNLYKLKHGYFAVKNPGQSDLDKGLTAAEARRMEEAFFDGPQWQHGRDRCGTSPLRDFLGDQLHRLIQQQLPEVQTELAAQHEKTEKELKSLGLPLVPEMVMVELMSLLEKIKGLLHKTIEAQDRAELDFWKSLEKKYQELRNACFDCRPLLKAGEVVLDNSDLVCRKMRVSLKSWDDWHWLTAHMTAERQLTQDIDASGRKVPAASRVLDEDWLRMPGANTPHFRAGTPHRNDSIPPDWKSGWQEEANGICSTFWERPKQLVQKSPQWPVVITLVEGPREGQYLSVGKVRELIERHRGRELRLPGGPAAYAAARGLIHDAIKKWEKPATSCVTESSRLLSELAHAVVAESTKLYPVLRTELLGSITETVKQATGICQESKEKLLEQELSPDLFTQNDHYLQDGFEKAQLMVRKQLGLTIGWKQLAPKDQEDLRRLLRASGIKLEKDLVEPSDDDDAIWCMCVTYAYHKVAFKRFCDQLPREVDTMLRLVVDSMSKDVWKRLQGYMERGAVHELFHESDETAAYRKKLADKAARLSKALQLLQMQEKSK